LPPSSSSLHGKQRRSRAAPAAARFGRSGPRRRLGVEGKGGGEPAGLIPGRSSGGGGPGRPGRNGVRQRAAGLRASASGEGAVAIKERGRSIREPWGCHSLPRFGPRSSGEGSSAVVGGGNGKRRRCKLEMEGWGGGGGCGVEKRHGRSFYRARKAVATPG